MDEDNRFPACRLWQDEFSDVFGPVGYRHPFARFEKKLWDRPALPGLVCASHNSVVPAEGSGDAQRTPKISASGVRRHCFCAVCEH